MSLTDKKRRLRTELREIRKSRDVDALNTQLVNHVLTEIRGASTVAAYAPLANEPGGPYLLPALRRIVPHLYLPIIEPHRQLSWALDTGEYASGPWGITEPTGSRFPSSILDTCDILLIPALAIDRNGIRLGQGAGFYDRALESITRPHKIALIYPWELLDSVPGEAHDATVDKVITAAGVEPMATHNQSEEV